MGNRRGIFVAGLVLGSSLFLQWAAPLSAQQKQGAGESGTKDDAKEKATEKDLDLRYAKAYVRVMEATLAKYQETNRRLPNTIRPTVIQAIQEGLREAQERVKLVDDDASNDGDIFVSGAEAELREEQEALRKAEAANVQFSGTISAEEIALLKARVELATINLQKAKHLGVESDLSNVRFELEQLREEVAELRMYVALLRDRN
ncbi:MAG TPA: hypothetical protein VHD36_13130 [Pirellulales bacterium]|nr:hypothetical protein [Pirellulales bacterium]